MDEVKGWERMKHSLSLFSLTFIDRVFIFFPYQSWSREEGILAIGHRMGHIMTQNLSFL